jgi:hypothetical protein
MLDKAGRDEEILARLPGLIDWITQVRHFETYYAVDRFLLALMLANIHERRNSYAEALAVYEAILLRYGNAQVIESYDTLNGKLVRIPLGVYLQETREKIDMLKKHLTRNAREEEEDRAIRR